MSAMLLDRLTDAHYACFAIHAFADSRVRLK
jgi:hypothetical protein